MLVAVRDRGKTRGSSRNGRRVVDAADVHVREVPERAGAAGAGNVPKLHVEQLNAQTPLGGWVSGVRWLVLVLVLVMVIW